MTKEEYRQHMRTYARETAAMSYVATKHPDYQALKAAGKEIIPYLFADMDDPDRYCGSCHGYGYEFVPTWQEEWDASRIYPPRSTGNICPECEGKGNICSWACVTLLFEIAGEDRPVVPKKMRGKHDAIIRLCRKWGEQRGYLPQPPDEKPGGLAKIVQAFFRLFR